MKRQLWEHLSAFRERIGKKETQARVRESIPSKIQRDTQLNGSKQTIARFRFIPLESIPIFRFRHRLLRVFPGTSTAMSFHLRPTPPSPAQADRSDFNDTIRAASQPLPTSLISQRNPRHTTSSHQNFTTNNTVRTTVIEQNGISNGNGLDNNSRNSMQNTHIDGIAANQQMERVTFHLFSRLCNFGLNHTSYQTRKLVEHLLLVIAICCACALLMLHRTFVVTVASSSAGTTLPTAPRVPTCLGRLEGFDPASADLTHLVILPRNITIGTVGGTMDHTRNGETTNTGIEIESKSVVLWNRGTGKSSLATPSTTTITTTTTAGDLNAACRGDGVSSSGTCDPRGEHYRHEHYYREWLDRQLDSNTLPIEYSYSTTKAYLMLPNDHSWLKRDMDVQYVLLAPTDPVCFGEPFVQFLLWNCFVGGNTVLLNWMLTFPAQDGATGTKPSEDQHRYNKGYVYNPRTQWLKEIGGDTHTGSDETGGGFASSSRWKKLLAKVGVFLRTSFLFFFCTTLVSFTLRETQERMLDFTRELSRRVRHSLSVSDLITNHLAQNLLFVPIMLGMMFFLIEFYNGDKFLAFVISSIVWSVEGFSLVCLRSSQGLSYFPYFFFLLFLLFHVYQTAFPEHGFVYTALTVVWCFVLHSMVFFWHRYELPALVLGAVTIDRPRMIPGGASAAEPPHRRYDNHARDFSSSVDRHHHLAAPRLTETASSSPATPPEGGVPGRNSSSSLLGGVGGSSGFLASRQSFQSMSMASRRSWALYQPNLEDDSSTGSHLYFMGGEVVVHRQRRALGNHTNNSNDQANIRNSGGSDLSPPTIRRENSFGGGNAPTVGPQEVDDAVLLAAAAPAPLFELVRNESNFSLLSTGSNLAPSGGSAYFTHPQRTSSNQNLNTANNNPAIGLDVTGRWGGDPDNDLAASEIPASSFCDTLPNDTSMETVQVSNISTPPKSSNSQFTKINGGGAQENNTDDASATTTGTSDGYYSQEVGGLQAIFETKLTPRHRNSQDSVMTAEMQRQPPNLLPTPSASIETHYQRRPPTFPELITPSETIERK